MKKVRLVSVPPLTTSLLVQFMALQTQVRCTNLVSISLTHLCINASRQTTREPLQVVITQNPSRLSTVPIKVLEFTNRRLMQVRVHSTATRLSLMPMLDLTQWLLPPTVRTQSPSKLKVAELELCLRSSNKAATVHRTILPVASTQDQLRSQTRVPLTTYLRVPHQLSSSRTQATTCLQLLP